MSDIIQESGASPRKQQALSPHSTNNDEDDDVPLGIVFAGTPATPSNEERGTPSSLSDQHKSVLLTVFQPEISTGKLPTLQDEEQSCAAHLCGTARFFETHSWFCALQNQRNTPTSTYQFPRPQPQWRHRILFNREWPQKGLEPSRCGRHRGQIQGPQKSSAQEGNLIDVSTGSCAVPHSGVRGGDPLLREGDLAAVQPPIGSCPWVVHLWLKFALSRMKGVLPPALVGHLRLKFALARRKEMPPSSLASASHRCVSLLPFFALVGLSSLVKVCLFEDEGDVQTPIAVCQGSNVGWGSQPPGSAPQTRSVSR